MEGERDTNVFRITQKKVADPNIDYVYVKGGKSYLLGQDRSKK